MRLSIVVFQCPYNAAQRLNTSRNVGLFILTIVGLMLTGLIVWAEFALMPIGALLAALKRYGDIPVNAG